MKDNRDKYISPWDWGDRCFNVAQPGYPSRDTANFGVNPRHFGFGKRPHTFYSLNHLEEHSPYVAYLLFSLALTPLFLSSSAYCSEYVSLPPPDDSLFYTSLSFRIFHSGAVC